MRANPTTIVHRRPDLEAYGDVELVDLARGGDEAAIGTIVKRHNQRLFRVARAVVRNDAEAEDVVQAAYVNAFTNLQSFRGEALLSTWLTRIALNEALARVRRRRPTAGLEAIDMENNRPGGRLLMFPSGLSQPDPEVELSRSEMRRMLEQAVDELPDIFRTVFVLRDVEGMSTEETALHLGVKVETVKTRLHRARRLMRTALERRLSTAFSGLFPFDGARCAHMADRVVRQLRAAA